MSKRWLQRCGHPTSSPGLAVTTRLRLDLQLFADGEEKTEQATPHRLQEVRRKGQAPRSADLNAAVVMAAVVMLLWWTWDDFLRQLGNELVWLWREPLGHEVTAQNLMAWLTQVALTGLSLLLPIFALAMAAGVAANYLQVGFIFSAEPLRPKLENINPVEGFKRIFSRRSLMELAKSIAKVVLVGLVTYLVVSSDFPVLLRLAYVGAPQIVATIVEVVLRLAVMVMAVFLGLALIDFIFQRRQFQQRLRMSRFELKEEMRQTEGDPYVRMRLRERQRQLARQRMMQKVPQATVVITNPTHLAVALKYKMGEDNAPTVVAKGADFLARRIIEKARASNVPVVENPPLAQALYRSVKIDQEIPAELYQAMAEILAMVYRLNRAAMS
ncbi:MAG: flagellar biosynthesis protein FlhB [Clostridia bacterium]|nr:MAG: flagellar biosynthesis protein FlhB [Clostridia bacterium]